MGNLLPKGLGLTLDSNSATVLTSEVESVGYTVLPASATVTALSNDESIATVSVDDTNNEIDIEGVAVGSTTVEVTASDSYNEVTEEISVTVE